MTAAAECRAAAPELPAGWSLVALDVIDSTNEEARRRAETGARDRTVVWAQRQTAGRGRRGRRWHSPEGNLFCTVILRPRSSLAAAAQLSFVTALALRDAVADLLPGVETRLKWPNDVLIGDRKVSGILLEAGSASGRADWLAIGLGVNLASHPEDPDVETPATSLRAAGGTWITAETLLECYLLSLDGWLRRWEEAGFGPVREAWLRHARGVGGPVRVRLAHETFDGVFDGLDGDGALLLRRDDGSLRRVAAGDVFFAGTARASREA